ncbi:hypothetical protein A2685_00710 [Candidatus Woesebacteria bacterium RIFCSPHIGHO2_01_FULL_37_10]|uniref:PKD domain-containing protein n=1 Tax=Candidatus Woesebacteria bacterium RIFCSPHIGHO2_01_FULL_37_10 TaxID=1802489 RepID=A0A1F7XYI5_9BACT|nr:MAG: hypothetical protein A2685_00710 [Candidatus Woesebacteria bacterium RIFCSPHIGHO2_01_FULL_37_10]
MNKRINLFLAVLLLLLVTSVTAYVKAQTSAPSFPSCREKTPPGDVASYGYGWHQIVGESILREGSDNVYSLSSGNYLQCFCPVNGNEGVQTNWWSAEGLTQEEINSFVSQGWIFENGLMWNLGDKGYLAKNNSLNCGPEPSPTPTLTPTQSPTPTLTPTPTLSPTPGPEPENPKCVGLSASPKEGTAPLTVKFTGSGFDKNGPILEYEFNFGDASGGQSQVWKQKESEAAHRYDSSGEFIASLKVKDQGGTWRDGNDDCKVRIKVNSQPQVLGKATPEKLPEAGASVAFFGSIVPLGYFLYKRFRLV